MIMTWHTHVQRSKGHGATNEQSAAESLGILHQGQRLNVPSSTSGSHSTPCAQIALESLGFSQEHQGQRLMQSHHFSFWVSCRGLTLSEEHRQIRTVVRQPQQGLSLLGRLMQAERPEAVDVVSHSHSEVSQLAHSNSPERA